MKGKINLLLLVGMLILTGCASPSSEKGKEAKKRSDKIQIGFTIDSKVLERWERDVDTFVQTAEKMGAEVEVLNANSDVQVQIRQIEKFIGEKKDVIVVIATDCDRLQLPLQKAKEEGIKVVSYDRLINDVPSDLYISFDNEKVGELMADTMIRELPEGRKIMMVCGPESDNNAIAVKEAFLKRIQNGRLQVVQMDYAKDWTPEQAFMAVDEALDNSCDLDGIMCGNDALATQAICALSQRKMCGDVCVVGQDADVEACQKIVEGAQTMTVYKPIEEMASKAAEYCVMLAQDIPLTDVTRTIKMDGYEIPAVIITPTAVTAENMDEVIIESGFHDKDDVYMNVSEK